MRGKAKWNGAGGVKNLNLFLFFKFIFMKYLKLLFVPNDQWRIGRVEFLILHVLAVGLWITVLYIFNQIILSINHFYPHNFISLIIEMLLSVIITSPIPLKIMFSARWKRLHDLGYDEKKKFPFVWFQLLTKEGVSESNEYGEPPLILTFIK